MATQPTPPNPNKMKISDALTVLGQVTGNFSGRSNTFKRKAFTDAQLKQLKAMIAKAEAETAKAIKDAKKNAKIMKQQNKQKPLRQSGPTNPLSSDIFKKPKPVIKVGPRGGGVGGVGGSGGLYGNMFKR